MAFPTPFFDAVVPVPSGAAAGGGPSSVDMGDAGSDPVMSAFYNAVVPTPGTSMTANASGLTPVERPGGFDSTVRARDIDKETPSKNLAGGD
jgi:hypothetical protein